MNEEFKEILNKLDCIPNINYGGCAISALAIKRWFKKHHNKNVKVIYVWDYRADSYWNNKRNSPDSCGHALVNVNGELYDSEGRHHSKHSYKKTLRSERYLIESINTNEAGNWNRSFNREHVCEIANKLNIDLGDVKC